MNVEEIGSAAAELNRAVESDLSALPEDAWRQPSDCEGWTVAAVVVHLTQVADFLGDSIQRGIAGDGGPPPLAAEEGIPGWRARRAEMMKQALTRPPRELFAAYTDATARLERSIDRVPSAPAGATGWHPVGSRPLSWIVDQWLFELALHDWDIRVTSDPVADVRPACQPAFARTLPARLSRGFSAADDPALAGGYQIELAGAPPFSWTVRISGGQVESPSDALRPDVTIQSDPSAFGLVMTSRRPQSQFAAAGRWRAAGDSARAAAFSSAFRGY